MRNPEGGGLSSEQLRINENAKLLHDSFMVSQGDQNLQNLFFLWVGAQPERPSIQDLREAVNTFVQKTIIWLGKTKHTALRDNNPIKEAEIRAEVNKMLDNYEDTLIGFKKDTKFAFGEKDDAIFSEMNADDMVENIVEIDKDYDFDRSMHTRTKDEKKWTLPKGFIKTYILGNKTMASI